jgi:outer membrane murein-binding lipoprotein Lpp
MSSKINHNSQCTARHAGQARSLAARAEALAAEIDALRRDLRAAGDHPVRLAGFRCDAASGSVRQAAGELRDTAADLERIAAAAAPGTCSVQWGACPDHGNTLSGSGGRTWCRHADCTRTWDHDRVGLPCAEPVRWRMIDRHGDAVLMCHGHAFALRACLEHLHLVPLAVQWPRGRA